MLGLTLDHMLIWENHINILHNKLKFSVTKLLTRVDENVVYRMVDSSLQYENVCWDGVYKYLKTKL